MIQHNENQDLPDPDEILEVDETEADEEIWRPRFDKPVTEGINTMFLSSAVTLTEEALKI